jgi:hypothetical protein
LVSASCLFPVCIIHAEPLQIKSLSLAHLGKTALPSRPRLSHPWRLLCCLFQFSFSSPFLSSSSSHFHPIIPSHPTGEFPTLH